MFRTSCFFLLAVYSVAKKTCHRASSVRDLGIGALGHPAWRASAPPRNATAIGGAASSADAGPASETSERPSLRSPSRPRLSTVSSFESMIDIIKPFDRLAMEEWGSLRATSSEVELAVSPGARASAMLDGIIRMHGGTVAHAWNYVTGGFDANRVSKVAWIEEKEENAWESVERDGQPRVLVTGLVRSEDEELIKSIAYADGFGDLMNIRTLHVLVEATNPRRNVVLLKFETRRDPHRQIVIQVPMHGVDFKEKRIYTVDDQETILQTWKMFKTRTCDEDTGSEGERSA